MNQAHKVCSIRCHDWSADGHPAKLHKHNWHISTKLTNMYHKSLHIWYINAISTIAEIKSALYQHQFFHHVQYYQNRTNAISTGIISTNTIWPQQTGQPRQPEQPKGSRNNLRDISNQSNQESQCNIRDVSNQSNQGNQGNQDKKKSNINSRQPWQPRQPGQPTAKNICTRIWKKTEKLHYFLNKVFKKRIFCWTKLAYKQVI